MEIENLSIDDKYKKWLKSIYEKNIAQTQSNVDRLNMFNNLESFHVENVCNKHRRLNDKLPIEYRDIYHFPSYLSLSDFISSVESLNNNEKEIKVNGSKTIYDDVNWEVKVITTKEAAQIYGKHTKWCISAIDGNAWDNYKNNTFYIVFNKKADKENPFKKFIIQTDLNGFMCIWDVKDYSYGSNVLYLLDIDLKSIIESHRSNKYIDRLLSTMNEKVVNILCQSNAIIAGGALLSVVEGKEVNDHDIWFENEVDYNRALELFDGCDIFSRYGTKNAFNFCDKLNFNDFFSDAKTTEKNTKIQIINKSRYSFGDTKKIIDQFDFTCVMAGYSFRENKIVVNDQFFNHNRSKLIMLNRVIKNPASLLSRVLKYTKKGYHLTTHTHKEILTHLSGITPQEIDDAAISY